MHPKIIAHRGWTETATENTRESVSEAIARGVAGLEFDVRRTADDRWVVHHDPDLDRIYGDPTAIDSLPLAELTRRHPVAPLDEILRLFPPTCCPYIEIKQPKPDGLDEIVALARELGPAQPIVVIGRGSVPEALLAERLPIEIFRYARDWKLAWEDAAPCAGYDLWRQGVSATEREAAIARIAARGRRAVIWTVNDPDEARAWHDAGADGIITDTPAVLERAL